MRGNGHRRIRWVAWCAAALLPAMVAVVGQAPAHADTTATRTTSIYAATFVPATPAYPDGNPVTLGVRFRSQTAGYIAGIRFYKGTGNGGTHVGALWTDRHTLLAQVTFAGETGSGWQDARFSDMVPIDANTTYIASYFAPQGHYAYTSGGLSAGRSTAPLATVPASTAGGNGVYSYGVVAQVPTNGTSGNDYAVDVDFTTAYSAPAATTRTPRPGVRGSGPVLVLTDPVAHFSDDYCGAMLPTRGIACAGTDAGNLDPATLAGYHTVILAAGASLNLTQVTFLTAWVLTGGTFVAMRPAPNLEALLGIGARAGILADGYLRVDASRAPGTGIDPQALQYHGVADTHPLAGARAVATLYDATGAATAYPAVTAMTLGQGTASAWMFDLAQSTVYTREGNPGLAGQPIASAGFDNLPRVSDRFALGYLDPTKVAVPQADLQIGLLVNQIETSAYPVPFTWFFPSYTPNANHPGGLLKAAFVLTGDDHATGSQTLARFATETAASPAGCVVADWTCIRSTSYAYAGAFGDAAAKPYTDAGFEVAPHVSDGGRCLATWSTQAQLDAVASRDLTGWQAAYPTISAAHPASTERFHCYGIWRDYASVARVEAAHGIGADANSACWPSSLFAGGPCLFTGTGLPQQLADGDGTLTGVDQFTTQATDENPGTVSQSALTTLVTNATGPNGYVGYFTVLAHLDGQSISAQTEAAVLSVAASTDVPVISAAQARTFWAARAATAVSAPIYGPSTVTFTVANPASNLLMLQPASYGGGTVSEVHVNTTPVAFVTQTINGVPYAVFPASSAGIYTVIYH